MELIAVTAEFLGLLRQRRIFHRVDGRNRWQPGETLAAPPNLQLESFAQIFAGRRLPLRMGAFSYSHSPLHAHVSLGRYCSIASQVAWMGPPHPVDWAATSPVGFDWSLPAFRDFEHDGQPNLSPFEIEAAPITIGHDVWIGDEAMIAPGVSIGNGAIIGARALVLHDVPPFAVVAGSPAKVLRLRLSEDVAAELERVQWWDLSPALLRQFPMSDPKALVLALDRLASEGPIPRLSPCVMTMPDIQGLGPTGD